MANSGIPKQQCGDNRGRRVGKPRGRRRDRDCRSCKMRGVKCDLNRPSCGECVAANVPCRGYMTRVVWMDRGLPKRTPLSTQPPYPPSPSVPRHCLDPKPARIPHTDPHDISRNDDALSPLEPACDRGINAPSNNWSGADSNSFIGPLVSLCQETLQTHHLDTLGAGKNHYLSLKALNLLSRLRDFAQARIDSHHAHGGDATSPESCESVDASRYRLDALAGLKEALKETNPFALIGIAVFAFFEVCDSGFGQWQRHLLGAKSLLSCHCTCKEELDRLSQEVNGLKEMIARLVWFDTTGAIIRGTTDLIFDDWHRATLTDSFFRIVGCAPETFDLLARVANGEVATDPHGIYMRAMDQLLKLDQGHSDWHKSTDAYRCTAVIAVLGRTEKEPITDMISLAVQRISRILVSIPPTSSYYIHLAVPAYMVGINAKTSEECDIVRKYWYDCNHASVRRYPDGLARCEERWKASGLVS